MRDFAGRGARYVETGFTQQRRTGPAAVADRPTDFREPPLIFSGHVTSYRCDGCAAEYAHVTPTSLLPIAAVVALVTGPWSRALSRVIHYRWLCVGFGFVAAIASLGLTYKLLEALTTRALRRAICPVCGAKLAHTGSGFYDGFAPNPRELLIYAFVIALAFGVAAATRTGA